MYFKLKEAARQFFKERSIKSDVKTLDHWLKSNIREELLEPASRVHVTYGHKSKMSSGTISTDLSGWSSEGDKAEFKFAVTVVDMDNRNYQDVDMPAVMDEIQKVLDDHFTYRYNR